MNRVDAWGVEGEAAGSKKPYYCWWTECDDKRTMQEDYKPIEGDKDTLPFLLDFSIPIGDKRFTIIPDPLVDPFVWHYEKNKK